jgi:D-alanine-D-alanine ligase-like ATP-grasp enzyme
VLFRSFDMGRELAHQGRWVNTCAHLMLEPGTKSVDATLPTLTQLWLEAARRLGIESVVLDPENGLLFELSRDGATHVMLAGVSPLNGASAAQLANEKDHAMVLLERAGVRVPRGGRCSARGETGGLERAKEIAERVGYPVIVKPSTYHGGGGLYLVEDRGRLGAALREAWAIDPALLVQERVEGRDFRLDFLDGQFLLGFERRALRVRGDGARTLATLLIEKDARLADPARRRRLAESPRCRELLERRGWTLSSVLNEGAVLSFEGPIQNIDGESTAILVRQVPEGLRALGERVGKALGLRHFGMDLKTETLEGDPTAATVVDVNPNPQFAEVYLLGQREPAVMAHLRVLEALFR